MRIAILTFGYPDRKNSVRCIFTKEQAEALVEIGADVTIFDLAAEPSLYSEPTSEIFNGLLVHRLPKEALKFRPIRLHKRRSYLRLVFARDRFDSALLNFLRHEHYHYLSIVRRHCERLAMVAHGSDVMATWQSPVMRFLKRSLLRRMDCVFAVSDFTATLARTLLPAADAHRVVVNYNGIAQAKLVMADGISKELVRRKLGIDPSTPLLLTTANLVRRKGIDIMLRVVAELRREGIPAQYVVVGAGEEQRSLEKLANDLGVSDAVRFAGRLLDDRDVVELMVACDIYCMISRIGYDPPEAEGFGIANAEAQAFGRPVIGGRTGGVPSAVADGLTGILVDPDAVDVVERIGREVRRFLGDNGRYLAFSEAARAWARSRFDWRDHARLIVETIDRIEAKRVTEVAC